MPISDEQFNELLKTLSKQPAVANDAVDAAIPLVVGIVKELLPTLASSGALSGAKSILASKTVWGGVLALLPVIVSGFGYAISGADTAQLQSLIPELVSAVGGIIAIFGRIVATKQVGAQK
jgi:hypothetical protein